MLVYRDAVDRVSKTLDPRRLTEILYRAEVLGDSSLAKTVLWRGYEMQNEHVVGTYLQKVPERTADVG
jgi:hypothetical protein